MPKSGTRMSKASIPYLMAGRNLGIAPNMTGSVSPASPDTQPKWLPSDSGARSPIASGASERSPQLGRLSVDRPNRWHGNWPP